MSGTGSKNSVRSHYLNVLNQFDFFSLIEKSAKLSDHFFFWVKQNAAHFQNRAIVSFVPFGNEPQLNIEVENRSEPYLVAYVRVYDWKTAQMEAHYARRDLPDLWEELSLKDGNKIFQPRITQALCPPTEAAVILVPALAFTQNGTRLGRGAGFYDRFLLRYPGALRLGIAFEEQIAEALPHDGWDIPIDALLTDRGFTEMKSYKEWRKTGKLRGNG